MINWDERLLLESEKKRDRIARLRNEYKDLFDLVGDTEFKSMARLALWYADTHDIDGSTLFGRRHKSLVYHNRRLVVLLYCTFDKASTVEIGKFIGRDHTTVLYHLGDLKTKQRKGKSNEPVKTNTLECKTDGSANGSGDGGWAI